MVFSSHCEHIRTVIRFLGAHIPMCGPRWTSDGRLLHEDIYVVLIPRPVKRDLILLWRGTFLEWTRVRGMLNTLKTFESLSGGGDADPLR